MSKLIIVSAPLFEGRPEEFITRAIVSHANLHQLNTKFIRDVVRPSCGGVRVYDDLVMAQYYAQKTKEVTEVVEDGDTILWVDGWNPAMDLLYHYCAATRINVKNYGIWHSSPITPGDYLSGSEWALEFQTHLVEMMDGIFVATEYMKAMCDTKLSTRFDSSKIHVVGLPVDISNIKQSTHKDNCVVFGHRWASDKRPGEFLKLAKHLHGVLEFRVFTPDGNLAKLIQAEHGKFLRVYHNDTKEKYYDNLSRAKFVWANSELETFGYFILEGVLSGAIPVLNDHPCYKELYPNSIYKTFDEQVAMLLGGSKPTVVKDLWTGSVERMFNIMGV